jgi:hypothetical protein
MEPAMHVRARFAFAFVLGSICAGAAFAQADSGGLPPVQHMNGIAYVSGGAGEEARSAMVQMRSGYGLELVFSNASGEYLVAEHVTVKGSAGPAFEFDHAGPMLLVGLAAGDYSVSATYQGKTEQRAVKVGGSPRTIEWRFPG